MSSLISKPLGYEYTSLITDAIDSIKCKDEKELKIVLAVLDALSKGGLRKSRLVLSEEIKEKISPVVDLIKDPDLYVPEDQIPAFVRLVKVTIATRVHLISKNPSYFLAARLATQRQLEEFKEKTKDKVAPAAGSVASTQPAGELARHSAIVEKINIIKTSLLGPHLTDEQLYGWANNDSYSLEVLEKLTSIANQATTLGKLVGRYHPQITSYESLLNLPKTFGKLEELIQAKRLPYDDLSDAHKAWIIEKFELAVKFIETFGLERFSMIEPYEISLILDLLKNWKINITSDSERTLADAKNFLDKKVRDVNLASYDKQNIPLNMVQDIDFIKYFIRRRGQEITHFHIQSSEEKYVVELLEFVKYCPNINQLSLRNCKMSDQVAVALAESKDLGKLTTLNLSNNQIGPRGARALAASKNLINVTTLDLTSNKLGPDGIKAIVASEKLSNLTTLIIINNQIGPDGVYALTCSKNLAKLTTLHLGLNKIGPKGASFLAASENLGNVTILNLNSNEIGPEGAKALADSKNLGNVTNLDLGSNQIGDSGAIALAASECLNKVTTLNLGRNQMGPDAANAMAASEHLGNITSLYLSFNRIGPDGAVALAASKNLDNVTELYLTSNQISDESAITLAASEHLKSIATIDMMSNSLTFETQDAIRALPRMQKIRLLL